MVRGALPDRHRSRPGHRTVPSIGGATTRSDAETASGPRYSSKEEVAMAAEGKLWEDYAGG